MEIFKLNFGGVFGGLIGTGAVIAIISIMSANGGFPPGGSKLVALAAFGGAALGNWIWSLLNPMKRTSREAAGRCWKAARLRRVFGL
jgi:hypothetical protein